MHEASLFSIPRLGWGLALPVLFLSTIGLASIHATEREEEARTVEISAASAGPVAPATTINRVVAFVGPQTLKQLFFLITGVALMVASAALPYQAIGRFAYPIYWAIMVMLGLLALERMLHNYIDLPFVPVRRDTRRWIAVGPVGVQPSEFMKIAIILALARYLRYRDNYRRWSGLLAPFLLTVLPMGLILLQPDLGTLLMLLPVLFTMLFVAGARIRHLLLIVMLGVVTLPVFYVYGFKDYQKRRVEVMFRQDSADERWHMNEGYQLRQSKIALGTGGVLGEGYGQGTFVRYDLLPERSNDFIFAILGHQWGYLGCLLVLLAYTSIVLFGIEIATSTNEPFGRLLAIGAIVMIVAQGLFNIGMTMGLAPISGMTLPFSAGGSSLWANFVGLGLMLNVAKRRPLIIANPPFEFQD
jgi:cell division protein FtsW (lipid II flippase)